MNEFLKDSDNYPFIGVMTFAIILVLGMFVSNLIPKTNASNIFPKVCQMGMSTDEIITVSTAQSDECLNENNPQYQGVTLLSMLSSFPLQKLQTIYTRVTGKASAQTTVYGVSEDILYSAFNAQHGANIPEAGFNISGTWPNLVVTF